MDKSPTLFENVKSKAVRWLEDNRGLVIVLFCLPASFLFDQAIKVRNWFQRIFLSAPSEHDERVRKIQEMVRKWNQLPEDKKRPMCTAKPNWLSLSTTFFPKENYHRIPINLHDILRIDEENLVVKVEPNVSVDDLTRFLIPRGYTLAVTLEIGDATAGGLAFGVGMTTYSHKVGLYQETILSYDVVLADGSLIHVTAENEHSDLYYCLPWSHGTLAFLVALELKLIRIKPYIRLQYIPVYSQDEYCQKIMELSGAINKDAVVPDYLEATIYDRERAVILVGTYDDADTPEKQHKVFQDIVMPLALLKEQVNTAIELFDTFPLLVYPCRIYDHQRGAQGQLRAPPKERLVPGTSYSMFNDLGVYGTPGPVKRREPYNPTEAMRAMEKFTRDIGGYSFLYADIFMNEEEFEQMFDLTLYREVRKRYHAEGAFPTLYEKVKPEIDVIAIGNEYAKSN